MRAKKFSLSLSKFSWHFYTFSLPLNIRGVNLDRKTAYRWNLKCREIKLWWSKKKEEKLNERALFYGFYSISCLMCAWNMHSFCECIRRKSSLAEDIERHFSLNFKWLQYGRMKFLFRKKEALKMREWKLRLCHKHHLVMAFPRKSINPLFFVISSPFAPCDDIHI